MPTYPVPSPANGVAGVDVTAAFWNAQVRDAINFLISPPHAQVTQTTTQSVANTTWTKLTADTVVVDDYSYWDNTNHRYTPQRAGWYWASIESAWASNGTGGRYAQLYKNGSPVKSTSDSQPGSSTIAATCNGSGWAFCNGSTDFLEVWGWQNSGGALSTFSDVNNCVGINIDWRHS